MLLALTTLLLAGLFARVALIQAVSPDRLVALGHEQRIREVPLPASRGAIVDRNGQPLALSVSRSTVTADPRLVEDPAAAAARLAPVLGTDQAALVEQLSGDASFVYLARQVPDMTAGAVEQLGIEGVELVDEQARVNPAGELARAVLGRVDIDHLGLSGVEAIFEDVLAGEAGAARLERDPEGRTIAAGVQSVDPATQGQDLELSLDLDLQFEVERRLAQQVDAMGAQGGTAIVSNPSTGELLAVANVARAEDGSVAPGTENRAVTAVFEPGSVNKVITLAAALEEGVVTPDTLFEVPDSLQVSDHLFTDHDPHPPATWSVHDILVQSSNIGTIQVAQQLGADRLDEYLRRFGFGETTALGFPNEVGGLMLDRDDWSGTSMGSIPIGQGISVTALQMLQAFNVVANGGVYVPPTLAAATVDADGERTPVPPAETRRVVSETTARQLTNMMVGVVDSGTGTEAAIAGYRVAGKTGTARKPQPAGGYEDAAGNYHYVSTFAGFVPADDPQLSAIVVIDEPSVTIYGGSVAAPVFADVARAALVRYRIPPTPTGTAAPAPTPVTQTAQP